MDQAESIQMPVERIGHAMAWPATVGIDRVAIVVFAVAERMDSASFAAEFALGAVFARKRVVALDAGTIAGPAYRRPRGDF